MENLHLNTLLFSFPQEPITCYFSDTDRDDIPLSPLSNRYPIEIIQLFPNIVTGTKIYTSFTRPIDGFLPLSIDLSHPDNFFFAKRYYNREIIRYFRTRNIIARENFIKDTEIYLYDHQDTVHNYTFEVYDRFSLKINFNHIYQSPELVISYERTMRVLGMSLQQFSARTTEGCSPFEESSSACQLPLKYINKLLFVPDDSSALRYKQILTAKQYISKQFSFQNAYPVISQQLMQYFQIPVQGDDYARAKVNRYTRYLAKIENLINKYLYSSDFLRLLPLASSFTSTSAAQVSDTAMQLRFANNSENRVPQIGLNQGTYQNPNYINIQLFFIAPYSQKDLANYLSSCLKNGYGDGKYRYAGLDKYLGITFQVTKGVSIAFDDNLSKPISFIQEELIRRKHLFADPNTQYLCIYLSPINKHTADPEKHLQYYHIKELLLNYGIASQCIDKQKLQEQIADDQRRNRNGLVYSLQNISVAINAKLGGQPWIIAAPQQRELIIGIGAFHDRHSKHPYIGAAFVFNNAGAFSKYTYFNEDSIELLSGAIQQHIINYRDLFASPSRIIIHYYKKMRERDADFIQTMLDDLQLDIPFYIVNINETESESIFVFDQANPEKMPYSGKYVALGNNTYLLCNNTRYFNSKLVPESYPFPVKIQITSRGIDGVSQDTILKLIEQVYQFSRIYWKSVRQQNLPVTIMYPKMMAEIMPNFRHEGAASMIQSDRLWFL